MKNQISLLLVEGGTLDVDKAQIRVLERHLPGTRVTLEDGAQHHVAEDISDVLELLKSRGE